MNFIPKSIIKFVNIIKTGKKIQNDLYFKNARALTALAYKKQPKRTAIINFLMTLTESEYYLEIGVRNPDKNFNHVRCKHKFSVDPGVEFKDNPVNFELTSDAFFEALQEQKLNMPSNTKFDIIFIDGLHIANQVEKDIENSLKFIKDNGFIILHDCNPPTEFHQREDYYFRNSPAGDFWNGTTWKAFYKFRHHQDLYSICFDTDWGIGVLSKSKRQLFNNLSHIENPYFEYSILEKNKKVHLNLYSFDVWKGLILNNNKT